MKSEETTRRLKPYAPFAVRLLVAVLAGLGAGCVTDSGGRESEGVIAGSERSNLTPAVLGDGWPTARLAWAPLTG